MSVRFVYEQPRLIKLDDSVEWGMGQFEQPASVCLPGPTVEPDCTNGTRAIAECTTGPTYIFGGGGGGGCVSGYRVFHGVCIAGGQV